MARKTPNKRENVLNGMGVLVTRPAHQADNLCALIERNGGTPIRFPLIKIQPNPLSPGLEQIVSQLKATDIIIFVSANAVTCGLAQLAPNQQLPAHLKFGVIGKSTALKLESMGIHPDIVPDVGANSEVLLEHPELKKVSGKNIIIFRGEGGRELLAKTLKKRGANVTYAEVYRREKPELDSDQLQQYWDQNILNVVTVTSISLLNNLAEIANIMADDFLFHLPLVVVSQRMVPVAEEFGFSTVVSTQEVSDEAIVESLIQGKLDNW